MQINEYEKHFIEILNERLPDWKYIKGYVNCESKVLLECKHCGSLVYRTASVIRASHYKKFKCNNCNTLKHKIDKYKSNKIEQYNKSNIKYLDRLLRYFKSHTIYIKECKICNNKYETKYNNKKYCDNCVSSNKAYDKNHSNKSLKKLYEKENGICYICNKKCDYEDYTYRGNTFIAGNYYPSIDHVIPLCKGGTDDWNNLRLAHRLCNSYKSLEDKA